MQVFIFIVIISLFFFFKCSLLLLKRKSKSIFKCPLLTAKSQEAYQYKKKAQICVFHHGFCRRTKLYVLLFCSSKLWFYSFFSDQICPPVISFYILNSCPYNCNFFLFNFFPLHLNLFVKHFDLPLCMKC